ncbi:CpsD/CapB family tyrosine-protein kinase [bacterium]|nr:CpsD/CapB family tyrosine-protein kinase [bacterium]
MKIHSEPIVMISDANGAVAESYRSLRVALSKQMAQNQRVFAFVSAWPGDGKSMVCTNLAVALSQLHQKVLLIDGDLRRPTISRVFGAQDRPGISDDLEKFPETFLLGYATRYPNAYLLPKGLSEVSAANLLNPDRLQKIFAALRAEYDCIIIDSPPLSACSDALMLGAQADGAILVVSPKGWDGEVEVRYKQQLVDHGIAVLGVVLNGSLGAESHGYGYGYGYGYGSYGSSYGSSYGNYGTGEKRKRPPKAGKTGFAWPWTRPDDEA